MDVCESREIRLLILGPDAGDVFANDRLNHLPCPGDGRLRYLVGSYRWYTRLTYALISCNIVGTDMPIVPGEACHRGGLSLRLFKSAFLL